MTKTPILLLSLLALGCVQIPAAEGIRPKDKDMEVPDASKDLDGDDLDMPDLDAPDLAEMTPDMPEMSVTPCDDEKRRFIGALAPDGVTCIPTECQMGFLDANQDLSSPNTDGCECKTLDLPGDDVDDNCDGFDGDLSSSLFVSPLGGDINEGTSREQPLKTLHAAHQKAQANPNIKYILIAQGTYEGTNAELVAGVNLYGGYDPSTWSYNKDPSTTILIGAADNDSPTLLASDLNKPTKVENLTLKGPTYVDKSGRTAYTVRAINSLAQLSFKSCIIEGGAGAHGADGIDGTDAMTMTPSTGNMGGLSLCGANGGRGGTNINACFPDPTISPTRSEAGLVGLNSNATPGAGAAQGSNNCIANVSCDFGEAGKNGSPGGDGAHGTPPMPNPTAPFSPAGSWQAPTTTLGGEGKDAAGGGGGGAGGASIRSTSGTPGAGGGGGAGGCGGTAATSGQSGGASIALIAIKTKLSLVDTAITLGRAGNGGKGGKGGKGSLGTAGSDGSNASGAGCFVQENKHHGIGGKGGKGGDGGDGASGLGGCAGSLYGVVIDNNSALNEEALLNLIATGGEPGQPGEGGEAPSDRSTPGLAGCVGTREDGVFSFQAP